MIRVIMCMLSHGLQTLESKTSTFWPYELIAVATSIRISIWQMASNPDPNGRLSVEKVVMFPCHDNKVWQMEWDMSGMTLALISGTDGRVRLWQSNLNGVWHEQAVIEPAT